MADQRQWYKLWVSCLDDQAWEDLSLEDWARLVRLHAWIARHGESGRVTVNEPCKALQTVLRVGDWRAVTSTVTRFPGILIQCDARTPSLAIITVRKWRKYQEDSSTERMRKHRARRQDQRDDSVPSPSVTCDGPEERRGEERRGTPSVVPPVTHTEPDLTQLAYHQSRRHTIEQTRRGNGQRIWRCWGVEGQHSGICAEGILE